MYSLINLRKSLLILTAGLLFALCHAPLSKAYSVAPTDDAQAKVFVDSLYGDRIRKAQRTREEDDDLELMSEMLDIVSTLPKQPDARTALYLRIVEMANTSKVGYEKALDALCELSEHNPKHPSSGAQAKLDVYSSWYRAGGRNSRVAVGADYFEALLSAADDALVRGDLINAKRWYNDAGSVQRVARIAQDVDLRERLVVLRGAEKRAREAGRLMELAKADELRPEQARRLIVILALEQGNIAAAEPYGQAVADQNYLKGLQSAAAFGQTSGAEQTSETRVERAYYAGLWYAERSKEPDLSDRGKRDALELGREALRYHVSETQKNNVEKARATILLRQLDEQYAEAYGSKVSENNVLASLDPEKHMISGRPFTVVDGKVVLVDLAVLHLPIDGGAHYALDVVAEGDGRAKNGLMIWLPVGGKTVRLIVDGSTSHRTVVEGLKPIKDSAEKMLVLPGKPIQLRVEVRQLKDGQAALRLWHNGEQVWSWTGSVEEFAPPKYGTPPNENHFAIAGAEGLIIQSVVLNRYNEKD